MSIDAALAAGRETFIETAHVTFTRRTSTTGALYWETARAPWREVLADWTEGSEPLASQVPLTQITVSATQYSTPTATIGLRIDNPTFDWKAITPDQPRITRAKIVVEQGIVGTSDSQTVTFTAWVTHVEAVTTMDGTTVTVTAVSADWILTQHRFKEGPDGTAPMIDNDVDLFWFSRFQFPTTGLGLDPFFKEFVDMKSGLTQGSPGAPSTDIIVPIGGGSNLWDTARLIGSSFGRTVAGYVSSVAPPPVPFDPTIPTVFLPAFTDSSVPSKDLRTTSKRVIEVRTRFNQSWAERLIHTRRWWTGGGDSSQQTSTPYGAPSTDLRPETTWETWSSEENTAAMEAALARVKARRWETVIVTRLDLDIWLGHPILTSDGTRWVSGIEMDIAAGTMVLTLDQQ